MVKIYYGYETNKLEYATSRWLMDCRSLLLSADCAIYYPFIVSSKHS